MLERLEESFDLTGLEQVCAGIDVQDDRLVVVVVGFSQGNRDAWLLHHADIVGDPRDSGVWDAAAAELAQPFGGLPVSCVGVDAGFLTSIVRDQCRRRRWWVPTVGRATEGAPVARGVSPGSGLATLGKNNALSWWTGRVATGAAHFPKGIGRRHLAEVAAAEALTAQPGGGVKWQRIEGRANHRSDAACLSYFARSFRTLTRTSRPIRLVAV